MSTHVIPGDPCPHCRKELTPVRAQAHGISDDHILPRAWGGRFLIHGDTSNRRVMCRQCNIYLGACGHCVGALACVTDVARHSNASRQELIGNYIDDSRTP